MGDDAQVEKDGQDLVQKLLIKNPKKRMKAREAVAHPWMEQACEKGKSSWASKSMAATSFFKKQFTMPLLDQKSLKRIRTFGEASRLEKTILTLVAHQSHCHEVEELRASFAALDTHGNGTLTKDEIRQGITNSHIGGTGVAMSEDELDVIFTSLDLDGTGKVHYTEWLAATIKPSASQTETAMRKVFDFMDIDCTGQVSKLELAEILGGDDAAATALAAADKAGDGFISWEEFQQIISDMVKRMGDDPQRRHSPFGRQTS